ncbi:Monoterpene epsilon-lactone hydrolase, partial [Globisporangium splendens]
MPIFKSPGSMHEHVPAIKSYAPDPQQQLTKPKADGYAAPYATPVFAMLLVASLWLNASTLHWLGVPNALIVVAAVGLVCVHELLRAFCCSFRDFCAVLVHVIAAVVIAIAKFVGRKCKPRFPEWTVHYELFQAFAYAAGELGGQNITKPTNAPRFRRLFDALGDVQGLVTCAQYGATAERFEHNGLEHIWIRPSGVMKQVVGGVQPRKLIVIYYHGGGYSLCSPRFYVGFATRFRDQIAREVAKREPVEVHLLLANYRKIPEHRFPVPVDDALTMFDYLVQHEHVAPSDIVMGGDSAGGGLVVATLMRLRDAQREMPAAALCTCPYVDMLASIDKSEHCFIHQSMLDGIRDHCVETAVSARQDPLVALREAVSVNSDLRGLPPLFILAAEFDILYPQSQRLAKAARRDSVDVELDVHARMPHVFCLLPKSVLPRSEVAVANMAAFVARKVVATRAS